jgi:succinate dehydrogenase / fumarate reductase, cytochrome b subunit
MPEPRVIANAPPRPLSPHLQIYRFTWTMVMSIVHRATGMALYGAALVMVWWVMAAATGPEAYALFTGIAGSWFGIVVLIGLTWALMHHLMGGIRHLVWDMGYALDRAGRFAWAQASLIGSVFLTALVWIVIFARS